MKPERLLYIRRVRRSCRPYDNEPDAVWLEFRRKRSPQSFDRRAGCVEAADVGQGSAGGPCGNRQDYPGALSDHAPRHRSRSQKLRPRGDCDRAAEILERHLMKRRPLNVLHADGIEQDIDSPCRLGYLSDVLLDGLFVQSIDLRRLGRSSRSPDLLSHRLELSNGAAGEEEVCPLAGEGVGHRAAYRPSPSVDYGILVLKQHSHRLLSVELSLVRDVAQRDSTHGSCSSDIHRGAPSPSSGQKTRLPPVLRRS